MMAIKMPIIVMTTSNSTSVKAAEAARLWRAYFI
jgi:hypothetical protein